MNAQIPLALRFPADKLLSTFHGRPEVCELTAAVADGRASDWLFFAGPSGTGKTHLLLGACAHARANGQDASYVPVLGPVITGRLAEALSGLARPGLVCLDGIESLAGRQDREVDLFHFHNAAREAGARVIYAATSMPSALPLSLPDLRSRLEQCTRIALDLLDEPARRQVIRQRAAARGLEIDDAALDYIFQNHSRDLNSLTSLIEYLDGASLAEQRRITVRFVSSKLSGYQRGW